ncbi:hypothetical protein EDD17DRAFT_1510979 [Pisolithus thermaeus]|nr:hypothetical protein EDD17DRAFT_1510979 [Pisolithus thermaeus]
MAGSVGSWESLYKGAKGVGRLDMYSLYRGVTRLGQGHEEDLDCREWGIPEGSREYLEGGGVRECPGERGPGGKQRQWWRCWQGSRVTLWVKHHWRRRSRKGRSRRRHGWFKRVMSRTLVFNLPKKGNAPKTSLGDQHLISRQGWQSSGGQRN